MVDKTDEIAEVAEDGKKVVDKLDNAVPEVAEETVEQVVEQTGKTRTIADEPEVIEFVDEFEKTYPKRDFQSGHTRKTSDGREIEIDFETDNAIIEFKKGKVPV